MTIQETPPSRAHLLAFTLAAILAAVVVLGGLRHLRVTPEDVHRVAWEVATEAEEGTQSHRFFRIRNQGMALQRAAFEQPDLLPIYGSSELERSVPDRASIFFKSEPTGFAVFPVGKAGTTCINIQQKLASVGSAARGRKAVILISPGWFFAAGIEGRFYEGNFSIQQASALIFNKRLSAGLKHDTAIQLLRRPSTLAKNPTLDFAVHRLAAGGRVNRLLYDLALPLGKVQDEIYRAQDACEVATLGRRQPPFIVSYEPERLPWPKLLADSAAGAHRTDKLERVWPTTEPFTDSGFRQVMSSAQEWTDFDLLLRTVDELRIDPLLVCIPPDATYFKEQGICRKTLHQFLHRLKEVSRHHNGQLVTFEDHLDDPAFFLDHHDHLSLKGWMYVNQAIDAFFHSDT